MLKTLMTIRKHSFKKGYRRMPVTFFKFVSYKNTDFLWKPYIFEPAFICTAELILCKYGAVYVISSA